MTTNLLDKLNAGLQTMQLDVPVTVAEKLIAYIRLLQQWNRTYNLTAVRDPEEMVSKHLLDSLAVLPYLGEAKSMIDVGSGAGLPGIPLALCCPDLRVVLVDSVAKKTRFLTQARLELGLNNVEVVNSRIEDYRPTDQGRAIYFDLVIARAYASSDVIVTGTRHLHHATTRVLVMQGKQDLALSLADYHVQQSHVLRVAGLAAERHLLEITQTL